MPTPESANPTAQPRLGVVGETVNPEVAHSTQPKGPPETIWLIGISTGGFEELGLKAQTALRQADVIVGTWRQLNMLPESLHGERHPWPAPQDRDLGGLFREFQGRNVAVLASGDPMFYGAGPAIVKALGMHRLEIIPAASSASLACARLGWALDRTPIASLATDPVETLIPLVESGMRFLVLGKDEFTTAAIAKLLTKLGHGAAKLKVLSDLGSSDEEFSEGTAAQPPAAVSALNVIAVEPVPGIPLTRHHELDADLKALIAAALKPTPGATLWSVGEPSGNIATDWLRAAGIIRGSRAQAVCFESAPDRATQISKHASSAGVPWLKVVTATPITAKALKDIRFEQGPIAATPDAIYLGKAVVNELLTETAWMLLRPGGIIIASATTPEEITKLEEFQMRFGGELKHLQLGELKLSQWRARKPLSPTAV